MDHERRRMGGVSAVTFAAVTALAVACGGTTGIDRDTTPLPAPPVTPTTSGSPSSAPTSASTPTSSSKTSASTQGARPTSPPQRKGGVPYVTPHVLLVMLENKGYAATLGSCGTDPYLCSLAAAYLSATEWFGVGHPSLPNYLGATSGSTQGCNSDTCATGITARDLGAQLSAARIPWVAYMESMPSACYSGVANGPYARKHNPFVYYADNAYPCHDLPYPGSSGLIATLDSPAPPDFVWITPNLNNDMHDGSVQQGNAWLAANLAPVFASRWFNDGEATVIITMDENDASPSPAGGQVPMIAISSTARGAGHRAIYGNHYGTLRTIEQEFGLPLLGNALNPNNGDLYGYFG